MDTVDLVPMLENLEENIDDLEDLLLPFMKGYMADITSKLPVLEKAKLQVLVTYAIESIIFSALKLNGVDAREHPVFTELTRVKQYFEKIKKAEDEGPQQRANVRLDKEAAGRFIKSALSGNDEYDRKRADMQAKESEAAQRKFEEMSGQVGSTQRFKSLSTKRKADDTTVSTSAAPSSSSPASSSSANEVKPDLETSASNDALQSKHKKRKKHNKDTSTPGTPASEIVQHQEVEAPSTTPKSEKRKQKQHHTHKSHKAPKSGSAIFQDLLNRPSKSKKHEEGG